MCAHAVIKKERKILIFAINIQIILGFLHLSFSSLIILNRISSSCSQLQQQQQKQHTHTHKVTTFRIFSKVLQRLDDEI
jgi:hypothetical protein